MLAGAGASARGSGPAATGGDLQTCLRAFRQEFDYVYRTLRAQGVADADAEDLCQEVFLVMWRRWGDFDRGRPLRPWLAGIACNVAANHLRNRKREIPAAELEIVDTGPCGEDLLAMGRSRRILLHALAGLPDKYRAVLVLRDVEGVPMREIAARQGVPLFTAYSRLRRARRDFSRVVRRLRHLPAVAPAVSIGRQGWRVAGAERALQHRVWGGLRAGRQRRGPRHPPAAPRVGPESVGGGASATVMAVALAVAVAAALALWWWWGRGDREGAGPPTTARAAPGEPAAASSAAPRSAERRPRPPRREPQPSRPPVFEKVPARVAGTLARGLVGYWRFDESPDSRLVHDHSGNARHCRLRHRQDRAGAAEAGRLGAAVDLAGGGWLECPAPPELGGSAESLTVSLWFKPGPPSLPTRTLVTRQLGEGKQDQFFLGLRKEGLFLSSNAWGVYLSHRLRRPPDEPWLHVAFRRSPEGIVTLFVGGRPVRHAAVRDLRDDVVGPLFIGAGVNSRGGPVTELFEGAVDELLIYDRALRDDEVGALARGEQPG